jgi:hypothetical protein
MHVDGNKRHLFRGTRYIGIVGVTRRERRLTKKLMAVKPVINHLRFSVEANIAFKGILCCIVDVKRGL